MFWWVLLFFTFVFFGTFVYLISIHLKLIYKNETRLLQYSAMKNQIELLFEEIDDLKLKQIDLKKQLRGQHGKAKK